ncbi:conjugal transfer protein TrbF [Klebsiella pneumoniae]|uniref:conjugal transfer protein TrbF n=1 Tax=Klebsiella pneumoniae TaxID=573 RepID=UPI0010370996|nr:conjugal transfer protein TrbF [Klebsiella pneumoniae]QBI37326.1 conjugal transfer protein TrbF [Klebsiella pneumoniae]HBS5970863.1 conjugal transfer protein TrbF [Klebsiella pneumoniae]
MDSLNKIYSSLPVLERNKRLKLSRQKRFDVYYCLAFMFGFSGLCLWWGSHAYFGLLSDLLTPPEKLGTAKNVMDILNALMYFVPFILFSLSIGCLATALLGVLMAELAFRFEYAFEKSFQRYLNRVHGRKNKMKEGGPHAHS